MNNELNFDDFWERLKSLQKSKGVSQIVMCDAIGVELQTFRNRKVTKYFPPIQELKKIADFFNVSLDYLVTGSTSDPQTTELENKLDQIRQIVQ